MQVKYLVSSDPAERTKLPPLSETPAIMTDALDTEPKENVTVRYKARFDMGIRWK
jgi:hypothetical protein